MRLLIIRRDNIGDLVCTTPLVAALRAKFPAGWIGVFANSYNAPVLAHNPDIDAVFAYHKAKHGGVSVAGVVAERTRLVLALRRLRIDHAIIARPDYEPKSIRLARLAGARSITAFAPAGIVDRRVDRLIATSAVPLSEVERVFRLAASFGIEGAPPPLRVVADPAALARARASVPAGGGPVIGVHLSARKPSQRWPVERFAQLIAHLVRQHAARVLVFWAPGDAASKTHPGDDDKAARVLEATRGLPVAGVRTEALAELVGGLAACDQVILADGGAMHVAAGLGRPLVCLFGDSDAVRWRPWGVRHELLQPASRDVVDIDVETVARAYATLVSTGRAAG